MRHSTRFLTNAAAQALLWAAIALAAALVLVWAGNTHTTGATSVLYLGLLTAAVFLIRFLWLLIDFVVAAFQNAGDIVRRGLEGDE